MDLWILTSLATGLQVLGHSGDATLVVFLPIMALPHRDAALHALLSMSRLWSLEV